MAKPSIMTQVSYCIHVSQKLWSSSQCCSANHSPMSLPSKHKPPDLWLQFEPNSAALKNTQTWPLESCSIFHSLPRWCQNFLSSYPEQKNLTYFVKWREIIGEVPALCWSLRGPESTPKIQWFFLTDGEHKYHEEERKCHNEWAFAKVLRADTLSLQAILTAFVELLPA